MAVSNRHPLTHDQYKMSFLSRSLFFFIFLFGTCSASATGLWQRSEVASAGVQKEAAPGHYLLYTLDEAGLKNVLSGLSTDPTQARVIELPLPDGSTESFRVWSTSLLPASLAARYPELQTFTGEAINNHNTTVKLDITSFGFHAIIFSGSGISFIDPADNLPEGYYTVHYKSDERRRAEDRSKCQVPTGEKKHKIDDVSRKTALRVSNGNVLRTYRLALACDHQYAQAATGLAHPTTAQTLSKMTTTMNRINGVYERELAITLKFAENEDAIIWTDSLTGVNGVDPFGQIDGDASGCINTNQAVCDSFIGNASYDIGHVFTTGAGGLSQVGVVCQYGLKAQSATGQPDPVGDGFDIDYVSHEMGHEFGANHPFNNGVDGSCSGNNLNPSTAYEPGSGSTIMAYAGICAPDDLQPHSDAYFHSISLQEIQSFITTLGDFCSVRTPTGNELVSLPAFTASYTIPYLTPFELTAPLATDSLSDSATLYCWEQWNLGDMGMEFKNTHYAGPIFRSYYPALIPARVFPRISMVLSGILSNAGTEDNEGEKVPDVARYLTFRLTMRNVRQGTGSFLVPDDSIHLDVINTGTGFTVTSQSFNNIIYTGSSQQTVTWDVANTNVPPISDSAVDIFLSADGGNTWPVLLGTFPNNGSATVTLPAIDSTISAARIKVKGAGNMFFNVNGQPFEVIQAVDLKIYPVPANDVLHITTGSASNVHMVIHNSIGQQVWKADVSNGTDLQVSSWARGVYLITSVDVQNKRTVKKFVLY